MHHIVPICCALSNKTMAKSESSTPKSMMLNGSNIDLNKNNSECSEPSSNQKKTLHKKTEESQVMYPNKNDSIQSHTKGVNINGDIQISLDETNFSQTYLHEQKMMDTTEQCLTVQPQNENSLITEKNQLNEIHKINGDGFQKDPIIGKDTTEKLKEDKPVDDETSIIYGTTSGINASSPDSTTLKKVTFVEDIYIKKIESNVNSDISTANNSENKLTKG